MNDPETALIDLALVTLNKFNTTSRSSHQRSSMKEGVLRNFVKFKETLAQVFSCEICEISKNTFFTEHLWTQSLTKLLVKLQILRSLFCKPFVLESFREKFQKIIELFPEHILLTCLHIFAKNLFESTNLQVCYKRWG